MRTIKFRGIHSETEMWVCGDLVHDKEGRPMIAMLVENRNIYGDYVIPDTVGQFTGLLDKNSNEIYEGDILGRYTDNGTPVALSLIVYEDGFCARSLISGTLFNLALSSIIDKQTVVGNVHDNPELLNQ